MTASIDGVTLQFVPLQWLVTLMRTPKFDALVFEYVHVVPQRSVLLPYVWTPSLVGHLVVVRALFVIPVVEPALSRETVVSLM